MIPVFVSMMILGAKVWAQEAVATADAATLETKYQNELIKKEAPNFTLIDLDGKTVSLSDFKGKVVVIDFWATWCKPCIGSFPGMQATVEKYKHDKEVKFLFIDTWEQSENYKEEVKSLIANEGYAFHVLFDEMDDVNKAVTTAYGVQGIPNKVIIDKAGYIRLQSAGSGWDKAKIFEEMSAKIDLVKASS